MSAGLRPGDIVTSVDGVSVGNPAWEGWRQKYAQREGAPMELRFIRDGSERTISPPVRLATLIDRTLEADPAASEKAKRIRQGILKGETAPGKP